MAQTYLTGACLCKNIAYRITLPTPGTLPKVFINLYSTPSKIQFTFLQRLLGDPLSLHKLQTLHRLRLLRKHRRAAI
jgi:hypothetical protein